MTQNEFEQNFLSHLNPQQQEAVRTVDGAVLLLAVPGSGKTTVLVTRLGYMVCCMGVDPGSILTMTYTVAATKEMRQRYSSMFGGENAGALEFRTINGLSSKIIEYYSRNYGRGRPFGLLDSEGDAARMVGRICQSVNGEYATDSTIKDVRTGITYVKNMMLSEEETEKFDPGVQHFPEIYRRYCAELKQQRLMDYDDQMSYALKILKAQPGVLEYFQEKYRYICVDESQDTSKIQHAIIRLLSEKYGNLFMVGDEDQSIYGFRAAYPDALMNFSADHPGAKLLMIEQNYRSTREIVEAAGTFVAKNRFRYKKSIVPIRGSGAPVQVIEAADRATQYKYLFAEARRCTDGTAVLFRNNDSALPLIDMLERSGIDYNCRQFDGAFFSHRIISDIRDMIALAYDPLDADAFMRVYYKFGSPITKASALYACERSRLTGRPVLQEMLGFPELTSYAREGVQALLMLLPMIAESSAVKALRLIWGNAGYGQYVSTNKLDSGKLTTLCMLGENEPDPRGLLRRLDELRELIQNHANSASCPFTLSTIHSSKGLEYRRVFLLDVLDGILPQKLADDLAEEDVRQYEEERRLYYVGMTRAKDELFLFSCRDEDSAFTDEVSSALPREVMDVNSVMYLFSQKLCGKSYRHHSLGLGKVIAQCGGSVLVEFESGDAELFTLPQLFEQRDMNVSYERPPEAPAAKALGFAPPAADMRAAQIMAMASVGAPVNHKRFGSGVITNIEGPLVSIRFGGSFAEKKFDLVMAFNNGLIALPGI